MKLSTFILAAAVALGGTSAFAQASGSSSGSGSGAGSQSGGPSLVEKAKSGVHKLGSVTRHALEKVTGKGKGDAQTPGSAQYDTRAMGGSGSSKDSARTGSDAGKR